MDQGVKPCLPEQPPLRREGHVLPPWGLVWKVTTQVRWASGLFRSIGTAELIFVALLLSCGSLSQGGNLFEKCQADGKICPVPVFARVSPAWVVCSTGHWNLPRCCLRWALNLLPLPSQLENLAYWSGRSSCRTWLSPCLGPSCMSHSFRSWIWRQISLIMSDDFLSPKTVPHFIAWCSKQLGFSCTWHIKSKHISLLSGAYST